MDTIFGARYKTGALIYLGSTKSMVKTGAQFELNKAVKKRISNMANGKYVILLHGDKELAMVNKCYEAWIDAQMDLMAIRTLVDLMYTDTSWTTNRTNFIATYGHKFDPALFLFDITEYHKGLAFNILQVESIDACPNKCIDEIKIKNGRNSNEIVSKGFKIGGGSFGSYRGIVVK